MIDKTVLNPITDAIISEFKEKYGDNYLVGDYEDVEDGVELPAIFIQLTNLEGVSNRISGVFRANCTFRAYVCESFKGQGKRRVRDTALDISAFVDGNFWGDIDTFTKGVFEYAEEDGFNEKIDSAEIWYVEWQQEIYIKK